MKKSALETLKESVKVENTPWNGHRLIYGNMDYAMNLKIHELTEKHAKKIVEYLGINKTKKSTTKNTGNVCECGCGQFARRGRKFLPGHDAKLKSKLRKEAKAGSDFAIEELKRHKWET